MRTRSYLLPGLFLLVVSLAGCSTSSQALPQQPSPPPLTYLGSWGPKGDGPGQLSEPVSIATDRVGNVFIADAGSGFIHKFGRQGNPLLSFQQDGLKHPAGITLDRGGAIYVSDPTRNRVWIFLPDGKRYRALTFRGRAYPENVLSVAVGDEGLIHILNSHLDRVFVYTPRLRLLKSWQPRGDSLDPADHPQQIVYGPDGNLYLANPAGNRIARFSREGIFQGEFGGGSDGIERKISNEFAVSASYVFAMDTDGHTLHVWALGGDSKLDRDLAPELGAGPRIPPPLAVGPQGELLVLDTLGARVLHYHVNF